MQKFLGWVRPLLKQAMATIVVASMLLGIFMVVVAGISGDSGTLSRLIMSVELRLKSGTALRGYGTSFINLTDSAYLNFGGRIADTSAFSTTLASKAIYIPGATLNDVYFVSKRNIAGTSTTMPADSCLLSYMAKTDSLIVLRQPPGTSAGLLPSGTKFSWIRMKIN